MKDKIHPQNHKVKIKCAACNTEIDTYSTKKVAELVVDVCSKCHPFYTGGSVNQRVAGRAEKFTKTVDSIHEVKKAPKLRKRNSKKEISLDDLAAQAAGK